MPVIDDYILTVKQHGVPGYPGGLLPMPAPTPVWGAGVDDGTAGPIPIGFSFDAFGTVFNSVTVNTNGWIVFGSTAAGMGLGYQNDHGLWGANGSANIYTMAIPWWDDLKTTTGGTGYGRYETTGAAPNRAFIFEWNCQCYYHQAPPPPPPANNTGMDVITFQVVLRESSDDIEYRYGPRLTPYDPPWTPNRSQYSSSIGARRDTTGGVPNNVRGFLGAGYVNGGWNGSIGTTAVAINPPVFQYPGDPGNTDQGFAYDFLFSPPGAPSPSPGKSHMHCSLGITTRLP
jgi:hypothetical protein